MLASLGHQVGISTCSACHAIQLWSLAKEGLGRCSHVAGSSFGSSLLKNSSTYGSSMGGHLRSPSSGCHQSAVSGATDGGRESSTSVGCEQSAVLGVVLALESKLESSKVTCLLGHTGLVEGACLLVASPEQPTGEGVSPCNSSYAFYS